MFKQNVFVLDIIYCHHHSQRTHRLSHTGWQETGVRPWSAPGRGVPVPAPEGHPAADVTCPSPAAAAASSPADKLNYVLHSEPFEMSLLGKSPPP